jgi:ABC-2 type transport system permease protein
MSAPVRPLYWCVRRELWENRFIFIAPVAVAVLVVGAYLVGTAHMQQIMLMSANPRTANGNQPPSGLPFSVGAVSVVVTGMLAGAFYTLGALYNERRDRSILFWKSLPVSDRTVVLSKAAIPLAVLPAVTFGVTLAMHLAMLGVGAAFRLGQGANEPAFWTNWPFFQMAVVLLYGFAVMALWYAPLYGWLLLVSAWAKRAPFLWAVLPPLGLCVAEKVAFDSSVLGTLIVNRIAGGFDAAFSSLAAGAGPISIQQLAPGQFLATPGLWIGLLVTAVFFAAAIRLRRFRGPI